jgi:signal transduction histidine kinase/ligand-binding sensor domain-containing protein/CheY-like chemotaxis protein
VRNSGLNVLDTASIYEALLGSINIILYFKEFFFLNWELTMRKGISPCLAFLLLQISVTAWSQVYNDIHHQLKFRQVTVDNGLTNNRISAICEDKYGYIWIATTYGLNRFNGIEIKTFHHQDQDSQSLPSDYIYVVYCDSKGRIWAGTNEGLCYYNEFTNGFTKFNLSQLSSESDVIFDILEDEKNHLWFATIKGLILYMPEHDSVVCFNQNSYKHDWVLPSDTITRVIADKSDKLWVSLYNRGLCWIDKDKGIVKNFTYVPGKNNSLSDNQVERIFQDSRGDIWIGTLNGGLNMLNRSDSTFTRYVIDKNDSYSDRVRAIFEDPEGNLYFGTRAGLYLFDRTSLNFILYANTPHKFSTLSANSILCSFTDNKAGIWLGTYYGGVNYSNFEYCTFVSYTAKDNDPYFLNNPSVFGINEDSKGNIYICTEKGINVLRKNGSTFDYFMHEPANSNSLGYNDVKSIAVDSKDNLWIGTNNEGLNFYSRQSGKFIYFKHIPHDSTSLPNNKVYFVFLDRDENLWVLTNERWGMYPSRLSLLKANADKFINYPYNFYNCIIENASGNLYLGGTNGFWLFRKHSGKFLYYPSNRIVNVQVLHEDRMGKLWIGSESGLSRFDPLTNCYKHYSQSEGYPVHNVFGILSDEKNNLWVSTNSGLVKMIDIVVSPDSFSFRVYNKDDGLPSKEFMYNASFRNQQGEMFFGTNNGLVRFHPDEIKVNPFKANIVISELIIGNESILPGDRINRKVILKQPIQVAKSVVIDHKTKVFSLRFDALHFANPEKNSFKYKLENFDHDWQYANAYNNYVTYTGLPKGEYTFKIYAANKDGIYCDKPAILHIRILPPFWQTWAFRIAVGLFLVLVGSVAFRLRLRTLQKQKRILEEIVTQRTAELKKSYAELQEQKYEILAQNEEIQSQNEEMNKQRGIIENNNILLETANKNLQLLNEFGHQLTATLDKPDINRMILNYIKSLLNINIFGLGIYDKDKQGIVFSDFTEEGMKMPEFTSTMDDTSSMGVYCFKKNEMILCNDFENEYKNYITRINFRTASIPQSVIYIPLRVGNKKLGVLTLQSYSKNAFPDPIIPMVESIASYIAIALDNATAYEIVQRQNEQLEKRKEFLEHLVQERTRDLEQAKNKAEESDTLKSSFLANMSHEIRTPLNAIIGFIELLNDSNNSPEEISTYRQIIKNSGFTLLQLINDIIDFSKMESGQLECFISDVPINSMLSDLYISFKEEIKKTQVFFKKSLEIRVVMPPEGQIILQTDSVRLQQIFINLLGNAVKFTHEGFIEFGVKEVKSGYEVILFVRDTGIGIEKKYQQKIFDRFYKVDDDKSTLYRGTGLGLSITKHLVEILGGKIWLESEPGRGSEFLFSIPYNTSPEDKDYKFDKALLSNKIIPDWSDKHFLIVEDEESNYQVINSLLHKTKVKTSWAQNGEEAMEYYQQQMGTINLVLMDIKMPKMDGFQTIKEIRKLNPAAVIIAQTAYALANEVHQIQKEGFNGYIIKPLTQHSLIKTILKFIQVKDKNIQK